MPWPLGHASRLIPATWLIDAARGVILRGAGRADLWPNALALWAMALVVLSVNLLGDGLRDRLDPRIARRM